MKNSTIEKKTYKEITIIFSPTTFKELTYRKAGVEPLQFEIPEYMKKYLAAIEIGLTSVQGKLTLQDAKAILNVMNGYMCYASQIPYVVHAGIALEVAETDGIGEKCGIDTQVFVKKLKTLSRWKLSACSNVRSGSGATAVPLRLRTRCTDSKGNPMGVGMSEMAAQAVRLFLCGLRGMSE